MYVLITNVDGSVSVANPSAEVLKLMTLQEYVQRYIPEAVSYRIVTASEVPTDRRFRDAWVVQGNSVVEDLEIAKNIAHTQRRAKRAEEFAPLDVEATIPMFAAAAEEKRQTIREKYAQIQQAVDATTDTDSLREIVGALDG